MMKTLQEWKAGQELEAVINELEDNPTRKLGTNYSGGRLRDFATGMGASDSDSSFNWDRVAGASGLMGTGSQHSDPALANRLKPLVQSVMKKNMKSGDRAAAVPETFKTFMTTVTTVVATVAHEMMSDRGGDDESEPMPGPDPGWEDRVRRFNKEIAPDLRRRVSDQDQDDNGRDE